ncbi:MAG: alpha/beta hydrolase [Spirochaetes bacterium]|nr:alpha/beta hydrolase [Spirochaetota bacterium]
MNDLRPEILTQQIGDAEVQYLRYPGDGPPLVLLHATGFLPWLWHPIARALSSQFSVIAPYFCDHRPAEPEKGGLSWLVLAKDLSILCDRLFPGSLYIVGHSMGATVSAIAAAVHGLPADRMALIEPIFLPQPIYANKLTLEQHPLASKSVKRRNSWQNTSEAREYLRSKQMFAKWDAEMLDLYLRYGMVTGDGGGLVLTCHPRREASLFMGGMEFDPWPILSDIRCPALVIEGGQSENRMFIDLPKIASIIPKGEYRLVENAGHLIPQEQPRVITKILSDFFDIK